MKTLGFISPIVGRTIQTRENNNNPITLGRDQNTVEKLETTSRGKHALTAMVDLTKMQADRPVPLSDIAARRQISLSYLEQMFAGLRRHGLVKSHRGPGGGYKLGMAPNEITVAAIIRAAEDSPSAQRNRNGMRAQRSVECSSAQLWQSLNGLVYALLDQVSLGDVVEGRQDVYRRLFEQKS